MELQKKRKATHRISSRNRILWNFWLAALLVVVLFAPFNGNSVRAMDKCATNTRSSYSVTVCFNAPGDNAVISGIQPVMVTVTVTGSNPGIAKLAFYLDDQYLLVDYEAGYGFDLQSSFFVDGLHSLEVEALMRDNYTTSQLPLSLTFANGITQPPVNTNTFTPSSGSTPAPGAPFVLAATGDGASGENEAGAVTDVIAGWNPNLFIYLGDVYEKGTQTEFYNWYGTESTFFGRFKSVTNPVVGNHEFENGVALGYFDYWDNVPSNYSYNANGWHFITLDSNSAGVTSQQYEWLVADLAAHSEICTIASYHHPSFNVGPQGDTPRMDPIWRLLVQNGVDIVLTGHDHNYQRWLPLDENGVLSAGGVTQFVAGGGGHGLRGFTSGDSRLAIGFDTAPDGFGSLRFVLNPDGAAFQYVNLTGSVVDSGVIPCRGAPQDLAAPTQPTSLAADVGTGIKPVLSWNASSDNTGVANYLIFRDGQPLTTVEGWKTSYVDLSALLATTYTYQVVGRDLAGNSSAASLPASITTPGSGTMRFLPSADTYVNAANASTNYGISTSLRSDISPVNQIYLRFPLEGVNGIVQSAKLRLYSNSTSSLGHKVYLSNSPSWGERTLVYSNAPGPAGYLGSSGQINSGNWSEVDLTSFITGDQELNLVVTTDSNAALSYSSREGPAAPELVIQMISAAQPSPTPTATATATVTIPPTDTTTPEPTATLADVGGTFVFNAQADSYINSGSPTSNYGSSATLRADASPDLRSYLRFNVQGLGGQVVSAQVRVYATSSSSAGYSLYPVTAGSWVENTLNYNNAPIFGALIGSSGLFLANSWTTVDVSSLVVGNGIYDFGLSTASSSAIAFSSREGAFPPQLVIETIATAQASPTPTASATPPADPILTDTPTPTATSTPAVTDTPAGPSETPTETALPTDAPTATPTALATSTATPGPLLLSFSAAGDAYVSASKPGTNYGKANQLRLDASPVLRSYLQFNPQGLTGQVLTAKLRIYTNTSSTVGIQLYSSAGGWVENQINFNNAPALGSPIASTGSFASGSWVEIDLTALVTGNGVISIVLTTPGTSALNLASRESTTPPSLVIELAP